MIPDARISHWNRTRGQWPFRLASDWAMKNKQVMPRMRNQVASEAMAEDRVAPEADVEVKAASEGSMTLISYLVALFSQVQ